jgi:hypothetical protein
MRKNSFILIALIIVFAFTFTDKVNADNPGQVCISDFRQCPALDENASCAPLTLINVSLQNQSGVSVCESCPTWYVSVWETDGTTYIQIGADQSFMSSAPLYKWPNINWDQSYPYIFLVWKYVGPGCSPCPTNTVNSNPIYLPSTLGWNTFTDFYPPQ